MKAYSDFAYIYDTLMGDVDYNDWSLYLSGLLCGARHVADCACGTGEITVRLAEMGFDMVGVDMSPSMLEVAAEKARKLGKRIPFICQDISNLHLMHPVDAIVAACDGVNYLDTSGTEAFFFRAFDCLSSGGRLIFDISSEYKLATIVGSNTIAEDDGDRAFIWQNELLDGAVDMDLSFFVREGDRYRRFTEEHTQYIHTVDEITLLLQKAGFDIIGVYEAFTLNAPKRESERIQFAAKRRR